MGGVSTYHKGRRYESLTAWLFRLRGYRIVARRWKCPVGEIDLIARRGRSLVFVEVKARGKDSPEEAVTSNQQRRLARAALLYVANHPEFASFTQRIDVVVWHSVFQKAHIENAIFYNG